MFTCSAYLEPSFTINFQTTVLTLNQSPNFEDISLDMNGVSYTMGLYRSNHCSLFHSPVAPLTWDDDNEPATEIHPGGLLEAEVALGFASGRDFLRERAEDFLVADDPALYSDEFSDPEDWGLS